MVSAGVAAVVRAASDTTAPILFFDGACGFCDRAIRFAMSNDVHGRLRAATLSGVTAQHALAPFAEMLRAVDSTVLYLPASAERDASVQIHSDAALSVLRLLGGVWAALALVGLLVPRWLRDAAYKAFARRRFRFFGRVEACELWPPDWRARMLP
jgi:predicted DCC family thiol-disulfide oxidoreductase YuxK